MVEEKLIVTYTDGTVQEIDIAEDTKGTDGLDYYPIPDGTYAVSAGKTKFLEEIVIPATYNGKAVTKILDGAFSLADNLKSITIPAGVTEIGNSAFYACESLTSITIPESVKVIGLDAFRECTSLESITIPKSLTSIEENSFYGCDIKTVNYAGTKEDWEMIQIALGNECLTSATIIYSYKGN